MREDPSPNQREYNVKSRVLLVMIESEGICTKFGEHSVKTMKVIKEFSNSDLAFENAKSKSTKADITIGGEVLEVKLLIHNFQEVI